MQMFYQYQVSNEMRMGKNKETDNDECSMIGGEGKQRVLRNLCKCNKAIKSLLNRKFDFLKHFPTYMI